MSKKPWSLFLLIPLLFTLGCAAMPKQVSITRFNPIIIPPEISAIIENDENFIKFDNDQCEITAALFEYQSLFVMPLAITNKTAVNIEPSQYSITLHDGRDLKLMKMLNRDALMAVKAKMEGGAVSGGLESQLIGNTVNTVMSITTKSSKSAVLKGLDQAIDNYFSFRPIYKQETRNGILCFMVDFKNEYPVTLLVKLKGQEIKLKFIPQGIATPESANNLSGLD